MAIPVQRHVGHITLPDPEQFEHLSVFGGERGLSPPLTVDTGSIRTSAPVLEQRAHARYPVPRQYLHLFCSCCFTLFISTTINAEITPTAPPENDATMGST